jgi:bifunctional non-homologous end joining protein LigD
MATLNPIDELPASLRARLDKSVAPKWVPPMLATVVPEPFSREGWWFEPKLDGERCLALRSDSDIRIFSRNKKQLNDRYPELVEAFRTTKKHLFAVDGEIVTFDGDVTSFAKLQQRMQARHPSEELRRRGPVWIYVFDLIYLNGFDLRQLPLRNRNELCAEHWSMQIRYASPNIVEPTAKVITAKPAGKAGKASLRRTLRVCTCQGDRASG